MYNYPIKPMVYGRQTVDILAGEDFDFNPFKYLVVSYGTHPCCYIGVPYGLSVNVDNIRCHGGVTWAKKELPASTLLFLADKDFLKDTWWFGWDYAHGWNDYIFPEYSLFDQEIIRNHNKGTGLKQWSTEEMIKDCKDVINQLIEMMGASGDGISKLSELKGVGK